MNSSIRALNRVVTKHSLKSFAFRIGSSLLICLLAGAGRAYPDDDGTPLASLSKDEILTAVQILKQAAKVTGDSRFSLIALHEPSKHEVLEPRPGSKPNREAFMVVYERNSNQTFEAIVDLSSRKVSSWKEIYDVQPTGGRPSQRDAEEATDHPAGRDELPSA